MHQSGWILMIAVATGVAGGAAGATAAETGEALKPIRIVAIGDSTVCDYPKDPSIAGWAQMLPELLNEKAKVTNLARSGRSSKSFITEGLWDKALAEHADYLLIQFGHNDCPGKPAATDPKTEFRDNLRRYITETRQAGGTPILVTPVARRTFRADGTLTDTLRPYAEAMIAVGREEKVAVIDLHQASSALYLRLGDAGSADLNCAATDRTHFSPKGARAMAGLVAAALRQAEPRLASYLKDGAR